MKLLLLCLAGALAADQYDYYGGYGGYGGYGNANKPASCTTSCGGDIAELKRQIAALANGINQVEIAEKNNAEDIRINAADLHRSSSGAGTRGPPGPPGHQGATGVRPG